MSDVEIVGTAPCPKPADFPVAVASAAGGVIGTRFSLENDLVVVCGGEFGSDLDVSDQCFAYDPDNNEWLEVSFFLILGLYKEY